MAEKNNHLVIMAGGVGSRFWPMSTTEYPKQFIDVLGVGKSLLQLTKERFGGICPPENVWVVTNKKYADIVREQLQAFSWGIVETCRTRRYVAKRLSVHVPDLISIRRRLSADSVRMSFLFWQKRMEILLDWLVRQVLMP